MWCEFIKLFQYLIIPIISLFLCRISRWNSDDTSVTVLAILNVLKIDKINTKQTGLENSIILFSVVWLLFSMNDIVKTHTLIWFNLYSLLGFYVYKLYPCLACLGTEAMPAPIIYFACFALCCAREKRLVYHMCEDNACERVRQIGRATGVYPASICLVHDSLMTWATECVRRHFSTLPYNVSCLLFWSYLYTQITPFQERINLKLRIKLFTVKLAFCICYKS